MTVAPLLFILLSRAALAFRCTAPPRRHVAFAHHGPGGIESSKLSASSSSTSGDQVPTVVAVRASELDDSLGLTPEERAVVNVHRVCSKSVVYVTSVLKPVGGRRGIGGERSRRGRRVRERRKETDDEERQEQRRQLLPRGTALGSGSGFVVDSGGYIVTNYHVIQRAYEANQAVIRYDTFWDGLARNTTNRIKDSPMGGNSKMMDNLQSIIHDTVSAISGRDTLLNDTSRSDDLPAQVFVRFGTDGAGDASGVSGGMASYHQCEIVDVVKELDVAVLKMSDPPPSLKPLLYGSSSDLLVGQSLLAIGNPFGLDRTITAGLVSALGRSVTGVAGNDIKNCIQTDAAINPGNSGGPLLTLNGKVVGVNTMIVTTSGSSAGIGFAVPGDNVKESTDLIVELDKERQLRLIKRKGRGWLGVEVATSYLEESLRKRLAGKNPSNADGTGKGAFVTAVAANSPLLLNQDGAAVTGAISATLLVNGGIKIGDRIINVGGSDVANGKDFATEMKQRVEGEQITLTVETVEGYARVVYVTLGRIPL